MAIDLLVGILVAEGAVIGLGVLGELFGEESDESEKKEEDNTMAKSYHMSVGHKLSQKEALARIQKLLGEAQKKYADKISDLHEEWDGNAGTFSFKAMGYSVSGTLTVEEKQTKLDYDLPWTASFFRGTIEEKIREQAEKLLA